MKNSTNESNQTTSPASVELTRRTLITTAAWTAPVVALAVAAPSAAASGHGSITFDFLASFLQLRQFDNLSVLLAITNSGADDVSYPATIVLSNIPDDDVTVGYDPTATHYAAPAGSNTVDTTVNNSAFILSPPSVAGGAYTLTSVGPLTVPAGATVYAFFTLTWASENAHEAFFFIVGSITFGSANVVTAADQVKVTFDAS